MRWCPQPSVVAALLNPAEPTIALANKRDVEAAAGAMGLQLRVLNASTAADIDVPSRRSRASGLTHSSSAAVRSSLIGASNWLTSRRATRFPRSMVAGVSRSRRADELQHESDGGASPSRRLCGPYPQGSQACDLPVMQASKFELVINPRPRGRSASRFRRRCSPPPTR